MFLFIYSWFDSCLSHISDAQRQAILFCSLNCERLLWQPLARAVECHTRSYGTEQKATSSWIRQSSLWERSLLVGGFLCQWVAGMNGILSGALGQWRPFFMCFLARRVEPGGKMQMPRPLLSYAKLDATVNKHRKHCTLQFLNSAGKRTWSLYIAPFIELLGDRLALKRWHYFICLQKGPVRQGVYRGILFYKEKIRGSASITSLWISDLALSWDWCPHIHSMTWNEAGKDATARQLIWGAWTCLN